MNSSLRIALIILFFSVIVACKAADPPVETPPEVTPIVVVPVDAPPAPASSLQTTPLNDETTAFLAKLKDITSYSYNDDKYRISVNGDKALIELPSLANYKNRQYTLIYLDKSLRKAFIACTKKCYRDDDRASYSEVPFTEFGKTIFPLERVSLKTAELDTQKTENIEGIQTYQLLFEDTFGQSGVMHLDNYRAFPLQINYAHGQQIVYSQVAYNKVSEAQVTVPTTLTEKTLT